MSYNITHLQKQSDIYKPYLIVIDSTNNIYIAQIFYRCIIKVNTNGQIIDTIGSLDNIIGDNNDSFENSRFNFFSDICCDSYDNLYILDSGNNKIKYANMNTRQITTFLDNFVNLNNCVIDISNNLYITDYLPNGYSTLYKIDTNGNKTTLISNIYGSYGHILDYNKNTNIYINNMNHINWQISKYNLSGVHILDINLSSINPFVPYGICHNVDNMIYVCDNYSTSIIYKIDQNNSNNISIYSSTTYGFENSTITNTIIQQNY